MTYEEAKTVVLEILGLEGEEADRLAQALALIALHSPAVRKERPLPRVVTQGDSS